MSGNIGANPHINYGLWSTGAKLKVYLKTLKLYYLFTQDNNKNLKNNFKSTYDYLSFNLVIIHFCNN